MQNRQNKLLEKVDYLLSTSNNAYDITLYIATLSKKKKNVEDFTSLSLKENVIVQTINEFFEKQNSEKENSYREK